MGEQEEEVSKNPMLSVIREEVDDDENGGEGSEQSEEPEAVTEEELALRVRRMMTEILLDVTNNEIRHVAEEVHHRAASKQGVYI